MQICKKIIADSSQRILSLILGLIDSFSLLQLLRVLTTPILG